MADHSFNGPAIPIVDISAFVAGSPKQQQQAADQLTEACRTLGFATITGHGVSPKILQEAFDWSKRLYDLPHEDKMRAPHPPGSMPHRGYSHPGLEKVYSRKEREGIDEEVDRGKSLRKVMDFKVSKLA